MSVALIAVVIALLVGHAAPSLATLRRFDWLLAWRNYMESISAPDSALAGRLGLALMIGLPVLLTGLLQLAIRDVGWGLPALGFAVLVLFWCWGPRDLDLDVEAVVGAVSVDARREATVNLAGAAATTALDGHGYVEAVFTAALRRWFGPLLWFLLLGPAGVLFYRIVAELGSAPAHAQAATTQHGDARWLLAVADWPAAQLMTLALALAANFDAVFHAWRQWHADGVRLDSGFLAAAARASVDIEVADADTDLDAADVVAASPALLELRDAMSLVWRMLLLWLAVMAVFVIARLLG